MREYTKGDCGQTGYGISLKGKVVVLNRAALPPEHPGQLFLCTGGNGANPNPMGRSVFLVSLSNGESCRFWREDVAGTLKPELLPDEAKLMLSQVRCKGPCRERAGILRVQLPAGRPLQRRRMAVQPTGGP